METSNLCQLLLVLSLLILSTNGRVTLYGYNYPVMSPSDSFGHLEKRGDFKSEGLLDLLQYPLDGADVEDVEIDRDNLADEISEDTEWINNDIGDVQQDNLFEIQEPLEKDMPNAEEDGGLHVHVFSLEDGVLMEENLPEESDGDDLDYDDEEDDDGYDSHMEDRDIIDSSSHALDDVIDDGYNGIEAFQTQTIRQIDLDKPRYRLNLQKRVTRTRPAVVEILAVVDFSLYKKFLKRHKMNKKQTMIGIRQYYNTVIALANERYATIHIPGMKIELVLSNLIVAKDGVDSKWTESIVQYKRRKAVIHGLLSLSKFQKWILQNKDLPHFDYAIAFTSYDMLVHQSAASGVAPVGGMCSKGAGLSVSLVVDYADYRSAHVIAHELGHSLGATHDGVGENVRCPYSSNHVMSPKAVYNQRTFPNIFTFSSCSLTEIRDFLRSPDASCLYDEDQEVSSYDVKNNPPGVLFGADEQCKMVYGKTSGLCSHDTSSSMCERLWCKAPGDESRCLTHDLLFALPGTTCDVNKRCEKLRCVTPRRTHSVSQPKSKWTKNSTLPPSRPKSSKSRSQYPDRPLFKNKTSVCKDRKVRLCNAIIRKNVRLCRRGRVRRSCCQSCERYYKPV